MLSLSIVLTSVEDQDVRIVANVVPLTVASLLFAGGAWIFGTALRLPFRPHVLGEPEVSLDPQTVRAGDCIAVRISFSPRVPVVLEEISAELSCVEVDVRGFGWREKTAREVLHHDRRATSLEPGSLSAGNPASFTIELMVPANAAPTLSRERRHRGWSVRVRLASGSGPDWIHELPFTVV